jgi:hypothetical protein
MNLLNFPLGTMHNTEAPVPRLTHSLGTVEAETRSLQ